MSKTTVLIVEDEAIVAADLAGKLEQLGYAVVGTAATGEEAVESACRLQPHVVLMDILLKGPMDGIQAAEAIRLKVDVPIIYLTAYSDPATVERAKVTGPFGYILKPFEERELSTNIEMALYKHRTDRELREQREWLHVTLSSIGDALIATDAEGRVTFINPVAEALTGWKTGEASAQPLSNVFRIINEKTGQALEDPVARVLREGRAVALANHAALVTRGSRTVPIEDSAAPILDAKGRVIGVVLVFHDVTEKRRAGEVLQQRTSELQRLTETLEGRVKERTAELAELTSQLVSAQENERRRVSYELHDHVWQMLLTIRFQIEQLFSKRDPMEWEALQAQSKKVTGAILEVVGRIRSMQGDLWPYVLDDIGILATIDWYCREFGKNNPGLTIEAQNGLSEKEIPSPIKIVIYRILQEALGNVAKYGRATRVTLRLSKKDHRLEFSVEDNGVGFDIEEIIAKRASWGGLGLLSIKARTELSGGVFEVRSAKGKGTTVRAEWPI